jgi:hypothetical protein
VAVAINGVAAADSEDARAQVEGHGPAGYEHVPQRQPLLDARTLIG